MDAGRERDGVGGGAAEIVRSEVPLLRGLGVIADWKTITADQEVRLHPLHPSDGTGGYLVDTVD